MSEINVKVEVLEEKIRKLIELKVACNKVSITECPVEGSGDSINMLNVLDKEYAFVKNAFQILLDNSIIFFNDVKVNMLGADEAAATYMRQGERL